MFSLSLFRESLMFWPTIFPALLFLDFFALLSLFRGSWSALTLYLMLVVHFYLSNAFFSNYFSLFFSFSFSSLRLLPFGRLIISSKLGSEIKLCLFKFGGGFELLLQKFALEKQFCFIVIFECFSCIIEDEEDFGMLDGEKLICWIWFDLELRIYMFLGVLDIFLDCGKFMYLFYFCLCEILLVFLVCSS